MLKELTEDIIGNKFSVFDHPVIDILSITLISPAFYKIKRASYH